MSENINEPKTDESFLEAIKLGHLFFYDTETAEVVHLRKDIYEAAEMDEDGMDLELTEEEQEDAEDAWEIIADDGERYLAMPPIAEELGDKWRKEFEDAKLKDWEDFCARKINQVLLDWLDSIETPMMRH